MLVVVEETEFSQPWWDLRGQGLEFAPETDGDVIILAHPFPGRAVVAKLGHLLAEPTP
jgi:hypothetical protein